MYSATTDLFVSCLFNESRAPRLQIIRETKGTTAEETTSYALETSVSLIEQSISQFETNKLVISTLS